MSSLSIYDAAYECLMQPEPALKIAATKALFDEYANDAPLRRKSHSAVERIEIPGRPEKPELISPRLVKQRKLTTPEGRATLVHAISHIEFNAINLALDAVYRFRDMPDQYYRDWLLVAAEEAKHFGLLQTRLKDMGYDYGDMPAHNGLWESAVKTDHDVLVRMALVPRVLEARGLDVTPGMINRLEHAEDEETVAILRVILEEEIGHVAIGSHWYKYCCGLQELEPESTFRRLLVDYMGGGLRGPFYTEGRLKAGFTEQEMEALSNM
ncbi:ferritin-like domain-containing protein [Leucothrix sargassi]|nr:ferritin-like domain-containing protein [Leucothrix sargassi]